MTSGYFRCPIFLVFCLTVSIGCDPPRSPSGSQSEPTANTKTEPAAALQPSAAEAEAERRAVYVQAERERLRARYENEADAAEQKAKDAKDAYKKAVREQLGYSKQQALKKDADAAESQAKAARDKVDTADSYEPPPTPPEFKWAPPARGEKTVHVRGHFRKDGVYVPAHDRRPPSR